MSLALLSMGVQLAAGGYNYLQGQRQFNRGQDMESSLVRPDFEIPQEVLVNLSRAEEMEFRGLPEEEKRLFIENLQRNRSASLRSISDRRGGLQSISNAQSVSDRSSLSLLQMESDRRRQNMMLAMQNRSVLADYKTKQFEHEYNEYTADLDYARAIQGAGMQNMQQGVMQGLTGLGQGLAGINIPNTPNTGGLQNTQNMSLLNQNQTAFGNNFNYGVNNPNSLFDSIRGNQTPDTRFLTEEDKKILGIE